MIVLLCLFAPSHLYISLYFNIRINNLNPLISKFIMQYVYTAPSVEGTKKGNRRNKRKAE